MRPRLGRLLALSAAAIVAAACAGSNPASGSPSTGLTTSATPATSARSVDPGAAAVAVASSLPSALAQRQPPAGAVAPTDPGAWALADRIAAPAYTSDTTSAMVDLLARAGIGTYADTSSAAPEVAPGGAESPLALLEFQAHALAVGAWAGASWSGAEIDGLVPVPLGSGMAPASVLLAAYVASVDSSGAAAARALMAGQNLLEPASLQFPGVVLVLFASDLATDGGHSAPPSPAPSASGAARADPGLLAYAATRDSLDGRGPLAAAGGICSSTAAWIKARMDWLFDGLKLSTPSNIFGAVFATIWNFVVDKLQAFVQGVITSVTDLVLGTVRSIAATIASVSEQMASLLPYAVGVEVTGGPAAPAFYLGPDPQPGAYVAGVTAGDLPDWPLVIADCAAVAGIALPDFHSKNVPVTFGPLQAPADPLLAPVAGTASNTTTDANGQATWTFATSPDPGDPQAQRLTQQDTLPVAVHRPELDQLRTAVTNALLGFVPSILRGFVVDLIAPSLDGLQDRANGVLDVRGSATAYLVYHDKATLSPPPSTSPAPSGATACGVNVTAGTYTGTFNATTHTSVGPGDSDDTTISGQASLTLGGGGSIAGSYGYQAKETYVAVVGALTDRRDSSWSLLDGVLGGTVCDITIGGGHLSPTVCHDSVFGDCSGTPPAFAIPSSDFGAPKVQGNTLTWSYSRTNPTTGTSDAMSLAVSGP